jgi:hypothetical protein
MERFYALHYAPATRRAEWEKSWSCANVRDLGNEFEYERAHAEFVNETREVSVFLPFLSFLPLRVAKERSIRFWNVEIVGATMRVFLSFWEIEQLAEWNSKSDMMQFKFERGINFFQYSLCKLSHLSKGPSYAEKKLFRVSRFITATLFRSTRFCAMSPLSFQLVNAILIVWKIPSCSARLPLAKITWLRFLVSSLVLCATLPSPGDVI